MTYATALAILASAASVLLGLLWALVVGGDGASWTHTVTFTLVIGGSGLFAMAIIAGAIEALVEHFTKKTGGSQ